MVTFRQHLQDLNESDFSNYSREELVILLKHHKDDLEEYKDSTTTAKQSSIKDIKEIEKALEKIK